MKYRFIIGLIIWGLIAGPGLGFAQDTLPDYHEIIGSWVRPDAPYTLIIEHVDLEGNLVASFRGKHFINIANAQASRVANEILISFELRQLRHTGSNYKLRYDRNSNRLLGTYHYAVFKYFLCTEAEIRS